MAARYYDDAIVAKLRKWIPDNSRLRVLKPEETNRFFAIKADDNRDRPIDLPMVALSRSNDIKLLQTTKNNKSFDGLRLQKNNKNQTALFNVIPIQLEYQLDIYTKTEDECDEYLRNFLFKLINNPTIMIDIPYNDQKVRHIANLRVLDTVSDTSDITERLFSGQFTRWTIQFEVQDGFLFSIPYKQNWQIGDIDIEVVDEKKNWTDSEHIISLDEVIAINKI